MTEQDLELIARRNIEFQLTTTLAATSQKLEAAIALLWEFRFNAADRCVDCQCSADNDHHGDCRIAKLFAGREGMGIAEPYEAPRTPMNDVLKSETPAGKLAEAARARLRQDVRALLHRLELAVACGCPTHRACASGQARELKALLDCGGVF